MSIRLALISALLVCSIGFAQEESPPASAPPRRVCRQLHRLQHNAAIVSFRNAGGRLLGLRS